MESKISKKKQALSFGKALDKFVDQNNALNKQVGGSHYVNSKIQPIEFIHANSLTFCQGNIIKYVTRYKFKKGKEDLEKAKHYIELLIQLEYGEEK